MNDNVSPMWHQAHDSGIDNGAPDLNDDFSTFLNFGDLPLGLTSPFDAGGNDGGDSLTMDTDFCLDGNNSHNSTGGGNGMSGVTQAELMEMQFHEMQKSMAQAQMMSRQHGMHHHHHHHHGMIPPTPTSMEMHAGLPQATLHNIHPQMMMDRFSMYREEPMIFTPLVSPAVTPLETEYSRQIPDFVMPFSPLTSPALDAHQHRTHMPNPHVSHKGNQMSTHVESGQSPMIGKKGSGNNGSGGRRRSVTSRTPARVVRESPSMKPQRKRPPPPLAAAPLLANALAQQAQTSYPPPLTIPQSARRTSSTPGTSRQNTPTQQPMSRGSSSNESVSPEPLPEVLMAPPPRRTSSAKEDGFGTQKTFSAPMTPATLMRLPPTNVHSDDTPPISMDTAEYLNREVEVTDASKASMHGSENGDEMPTPTMRAPSSSRTPSLTPSLRLSASSSVRTSRHTSPLDPVNSGATTRKEPARIRKRGSVSSSPALQPKISQISPSIKPLLPQGMSPDASAFLLASKSNYQNIVEGNHSHLGLQYPEHLSTNLTSKRTSHKIAEQGRRNRINNALAEMASLLPTPSASQGESAPGKEQTSKASTVELAIEYIHQLKTELQGTKSLLKEAEKKLEQYGCTDSNTSAAKNDMEGMEKTAVTMSPGNNEAEAAVPSPGVAVSA